jgi:hypothetical protein
MGSVSFIFKNSTYQDPTLPTSPPVQNPTTPSAGWSLQSTPTDRFSFMTVDSGYIYATTYGTENIWTFDGENWSVLSTMELPVSTSQNVFIKNNDWYGGLDTGKVYRFSGGNWLERDDLGGNVRSAEIYKNQLYMCANEKIYTEGAPDWNEDVDLGTGYTVYCLKEYDGDLYAGRSGGSAGGGNLWRKHGGGWSAVTTLANRVHVLYEASDGYLYAGCSQSNTSNTGRVYQYDGNSWAYIGDTQFGVPFDIIEYQGYLYIVGGTLNILFVVKRIELSSIVRTQDNSETAFSVGDATTGYAMAVYNNYLYVSTNDHGSSNGKVYVYNPN